MDKTILFWTMNELYYYSDTENKSIEEIKIIADKVRNFTGVFGAVIVNTCQVPRFAIEF